MYLDYINVHHVTLKRNSFEKIRPYCPKLLMKSTKCILAIKVGTFILHDSRFLVR